MTLSLRFRLLGERGSAAQFGAGDGHGPISDFELEGVPHAWPTASLPSMAPHRPPLPICDLHWRNWLSTFAVGDHRSFALLAQGFIIESHILVPRSVQSGVVLLKISAVTGYHSIMGPGVSRYR